MDDQFYDHDTINQAVKALIQSRSDGPALRRLLTQYALLLGSGAVVALGLGPWWAQWLCILTFALMTMAMFALGHETIHGTAFASKRLNAAACWLACAPIYYTPTGFRAFHFAHHRHTHDPARDPEIVVLGKPAPAVTSSFSVYLPFITGFPLIFYKIGMLAAAAIGRPAAAWDKLLFFVPPKARAAMSWEARAVLALHAAWLTAGALWLPGLLTLLWAQVLGHALLALYITAEHNGLPHAGDILQRTRTTDAAAPSRWLMWNMPYHAEHHAYPAVPWHALPRLHALLAPSLLHTSPSYAALHKRVWRALLRGAPFSEPPTQAPPSTAPPPST
jgi:fatty acid desaturase